MFYRSLPKLNVSGDNKGKQAVVQITNEKLGFPKENPILINQDEFTYPQFGPEPKVNVTYKGEGEKRVEVREEVPLTEDEAKAAIAEAAEDAGGWVALAEIHNENTAAQAVKESKAKIRTAESGDWKDVVRSALEACKKFTWKKAERITVQQLRAEVNELAKRDVDNMSEEEMRAAIKKLLGQAA